MVGVGPMKERCASKRLLNFVTQPWSDVPAAASDNKPAAACEGGVCAPSLAVSGEVAQYLTLLRARASLRWLWSA